MQIKVGHPLANRLDIRDAKTNEQIDYVFGVNTDTSTLGIFLTEEGDSPTEIRVVKDGYGGLATRELKRDFILIDKKNGKVIKDLTEDGKEFVYADE